LLLLICSIDLISAYKSTVNENEALKSSLAALTMIPKEASSADDGGKKKEENKSSSGDTQSDSQNEVSLLISLFLKVLIVWCNSSLDL
jgi:hypothetical protein